MSTQTPATPPMYPPSSDAPTGTPTTAMPTPSDPAALNQADTQLASLTVIDRPHSDGSYRRDAYGESWRDVDGNGCNQRDDVLQRDAEPGSLTVAQQGACDHDVLAGAWHDPYTGHVLTFTDLKDLHQAMAIQIDHVVPLAEAWYAGARDWPAERRERFANWLPELLAVDGPTNESKGDGDPAAWRPRKAFQCEYAERWIAVKTTWHLAADPSEVAALRQMLGYC